MVFGSTRTVSFDMLQPFPLAMNSLEAQGIRLAYGSGQNSYGDHWGYVVDCATGYASSYYGPDISMTATGCTRSLHINTEYSGYFQLLSPPSTFWSLTLTYRTTFGATLSLFRTGDVTDGNVCEVYLNRTEPLPIPMPAAFTYTTSNTITATPVDCPRWPAGSTFDRFFIYLSYNAANSAGDGLPELLIGEQARGHHSARAWRM